MNIQDEVQKIHHKYGTSEMANYEIQKLFDKQQERSYSEEEVMNIIDSFIDNFDSRKEWFKQFKKK